MKSDTGPVAPPANVSLAEAFRYWLWLGCISFGGPTGQIAIMHQDLVEKKCWISEQRFLHALNYCMVLPGPEAQQLATYIGWLMHRTWGGIVAGALFVLPSLAILIGLSWVYVVFGQVPWVAGVFYGIKPAVAAIEICGRNKLVRVTRGAVLDVAQVSGSFGGANWAEDGTLLVGELDGCRSPVPSFTPLLGLDLAQAAYADAIAHAASAGQRASVKVCFDLRTEKRR